MDDFERTVNFKYTKGEGEDVCSLGDKSKTNAKLDSAYHHGSEGEDHGLTLNHPNYLHTKFLNVQEEDGKLVLSERIYDFFDKSLEEYVNNLGGQIQTQTYMVQGDEETFEIIKPEIKDIIRSMISFVNYIHSKKLTFSGKLDYSTNFGMLEGVLKFWRISFSRSTHHKDRMEDFNKIGRIIKNDVLRGTEDPLPECLGHLLDIMVSNFSEHWHASDYVGKDVLTLRVTVEKFFQRHISLMSSDERLRFIRNCHNKVDGMKPIAYRRFKAAVSSMGNNTNWVDRLEHSLSVVYTSIFYGILKAERQETSVTEAVNLVRELDISFYLDRVRERYTVVNRGTFSVNRDILSVCRNVVTHSYGVLKVVRRNYTHEGVEIDAAIMKTFGDLLTLLQEELFKRGLLPYFM